MPAGYSSRCKVCNSQHRVEIERWAQEDGMSPRAISAKLASEFGESIGYKSIWQHLREHFDVKAEAREQYQKSQEQLKQQVKKRLSDLEMLDAIAQGDFELHEAARTWLNELMEARAKIPKTLVDLLAASAGEVRQQLKQKQAMLGEDPAVDGLEDLADILRQAWDVVTGDEAG